MDQWLMLVIYNEGTKVGRMFLSCDQIKILLEEPTITMYRLGTNQIPVVSEGTLMWTDVLDVPEEEIFK